MSHFIKYYSLDNNKKLEDISFYTIFGYTFTENYLKEKKLVQIEFKRNDSLIKNQKLQILENEYKEVENALIYCQNYLSYSPSNRTSKNLIRSIVLFCLSFCFFNFLISSILFIIFGLLLNFNISLLDDLFSSGIIFNNNIYHFKDITYYSKTFNFNLTYKEIGIFFIFLAFILLLVDFILFLFIYFEKTFNKLLSSAYEKNISEKKENLKALKKNLEGELKLIIKEAELYF